MCACRRIGSYQLVEEQMSLVTQAAQLDTKDVWQFYGNSDPALLPELETDEFLRAVHCRPREVQ
ncbi:hypothetical protein OCV64_01525 [Muriventricola aceti]|uniref:hypothetical protein n=1 Tax=Flintibacter sp. HCN-6482 TaxID=3134672 RepID=UPI0030C575F9|nr:hypothetical protein [Muriventricola aceti]